MILTQLVDFTCDKFNKIDAVASLLARNAQLGWRTLGQIVIAAVGDNMTSFGKFTYIAFKIFFILASRASNYFKNIVMTYELHCLADFVHALK